MHKRSLPQYATIMKEIGETPLQALERLRARDHLPESIPLAYAGRLDPMATGKLLILIGDECKVQEKYHRLDKTYEFKVIFGLHSDTGDILGIISSSSGVQTYTKHAIEKTIVKLVGNISLPYPHFSSKTIQGKPLHVWTLEKRLCEIEIPIKHSRMYKIRLTNLTQITAHELYENVSKKIDSVEKVTDPKKVLGADFRRTDVRASWKEIYEKNPETSYHVASFICTASSGTYMRSLAERIAVELGTVGLAYDIHRTKIGTYHDFFRLFGVWSSTY